MNCFLLISIVKKRKTKDRKAKLGSQKKECHLMGLKTLKHLTKEKIKE